MHSFMLFQRSRPCHRPCSSQQSVLMGFSCRGACSPTQGKVRCNSAAFWHTRPLNGSSLFILNLHRTVSQQWLRLSNSNNELQNRRRLITIWFDKAVDCYRRLNRTSRYKINGTARCNSSAFGHTRPLNIVAEFVNKPLLCTSLLQWQQIRSVEQTA